MSLSPRLAATVDALPLVAGMRVLEIGCGPGAAAREVARRVSPGHVLAIDRSARAIAQAAGVDGPENLELRCVAVEDLELLASEHRYDLAFAVRVGALDGRHPDVEITALSRIRSVLVPDGRLYVDGSLRSWPPARESPA